MLVIECFHWFLLYYINFIVNLTNANIFFSFPGAPELILLLYFYATAKMLTQSILDSIPSKNIWPLGWVNYQPKTGQEKKPSANFQSASV